MNGLPVHPLVVHAVVVLLPLACLGTLALVVRPAWRLRYGALVVAIAAVATVLVPVATSSGEALEKRVGDPGRHAELGDQMIWFCIPLLVLVLALVVLDRRRVRSAPVESVDGRGTPVRSEAGRAGGSMAVNVVAVLALLAAVATSVQVYRVGDSGAEAVWGDQVSSGS
ncbi:hypothetical protein GRQ65_05530 [Nocardioides sp. YIM 123512]|uniref:DUF2231 domain-containing protein n=1 Tax=Nocardioides flavescens TaxID=2691959 RepID=A0A6L7ETP4_9ACTN|nr:hypothetical protein [Nocardioides flavescens]